MSCKYFNKMKIFSETPLFFYTALINNETGFQDMIHDLLCLFLILAGKFHELLHAPDMLGHEFLRIDP